MVSELPQVDRLREPKLLVRTWKLDLFGHLLAAVDRHSYTLNTRGEPDPAFDGYDGIPSNLWWRAILLTLYYTGLRITAALSIRKADCEMGETESFVFAAAATQKQAADQRLRLPEDATAAIRAMDGYSSSEKLFPFTHTIQSLHLKFSRLLKRAGLPAGPKDKFHNIRRLSATGVAAKLGRAAAMDHLGHSCMQVTEKYLDYTQIPKIDVSEVLPRPIIPGQAAGNGKDSAMNGG